MVISSSHLWTVCKFVFVLSHGQSQTKRGFNINKTMLVENLQEESLKGQRIVYDHMSSLNTTIDNLSTLLSTSLLLQNNWQHTVKGHVPNIMQQFMKRKMESNVMTEKRNKNYSLKK